MLNCLYGCRIFMQYFDKQDFIIIFYLHNLSKTIFFFAWNALIIYAIICIQIIIWDRMKNVLHGLSYQKQEHIMPLAETTRTCTCTCKYATVNNNSKIKLLVSTFFSSSLSGWNPGFVTPLPFSWISIFSDIIKSTPASQPFTLKCLRCDNQKSLSSHTTWHTSPTTTRVEAGGPICQDPIVIFAI